MAHSITDSEGKLHKIAGNFNPSYEVSQLVAEKTITTPTNLITIDNLDIKADGGVYDFVLSGYNTAYQENIIKFQIGYNNAAFSNNRYYHQFMASYDSTVYAGTSKNSGYSTIGVFAQNPSSITGSISLFENFAQGKTQSFDVQSSNQILICGFGYYDAVPNITELYFVIDTTFAVGTTVKIYKRMANATVSKSSGANIETIYNMQSSDSSINWGYTSGIGSGVNITGKNFAKYKKLIFTVGNFTAGNTEANCSPVFVDLEVKNPNRSYEGSAVTMINRSSVFYGNCARVYVGENKTDFTAYLQEYTTGGGYVHNDLKIFKIEGWY